MGNKDGASFVSGWNDPPTFSYESQSQLRTGTSKQRTLLNKRVGFPLNEAPFPSNQMVQVDPTLPPTCNNVSNFPPPPSVPSSQFLDTTANSSEFGKNTTSKELLEFNSKQALETVLDRLNKILNEKYENDGKDKFDIKRRLDVMEKMWKDEKLCKDVQKRLLELSQGIIRSSPTM